MNRSRNSVKVKDILMEIEYNDWSSEDSLVEESPASCKTLKANQLREFKTTYKKFFMERKKGQKMTKEGAMAKYFSSEVAVRVATEGVQIFGGYGYTKDFPAEKYYRDAKLCTIGEGTSEIQKLVIAREILK